MNGHQQQSPEEPLYVVAVGAITNVASAILIAPEIIERIVIVWLGGNPLYWPHTREFNLMQDLQSAQVVLDCGVPFVWLPARGVVSHLHTTVAEMERYVQGRGKVGDYLVQIFKDYASDHFAWSKVIWDISATAYLINPAWVPTEIVHSPILTEAVRAARGRLQTDRRFRCKCQCQVPSALVLSAVGASPSVLTLTALENS